MSVTLPIELCPLSIPANVVLNVTSTGSGLACKPTIPFSELDEAAISDLVDDFRANLFASVDKVDPNPPVVIP